jgi:hypothetical protein
MPDNPRDSWIETLESKAMEIESLASWASIVGYGEVRDQLRIAKSSLIDWIESRKRMVEAAGGQGRAPGPLP